MVQSDVKVGGHYHIKVSGVVSVVRVDEIRDIQVWIGASSSGKKRTVKRYDCTNIKTARRVTVKSAAKFIRAVNVKGEHTPLNQFGDVLGPTGHDGAKTIKPAWRKEEEAKQRPDPTQVVQNSTGGSPTSGDSLAAKVRANLQQKTPAAGPPHLIIEARAGTGKTTTLVEGLKKVYRLAGAKITPSEQQAAVWESLGLSNVPYSSCFCAFNNSVAKELQERVPKVKGCRAMTLHSAGSWTVRKQFPHLTGDPQSGGRVRNIVEELTGIELRTLRKERPVFLAAVCKLVELCKQNLVGPGFGCNPAIYPPGDDYWTDELTKLCQHYDVDLGDNGQKEEIFALVPRVLERCKDVGRDTFIDFDDMIWLPVVLNLPMYNNDILLVDEAQDLNRCQQELALRIIGKYGRLILCGDPRQAIYGFAGADSESMSRMEVLLSRTPRGCVRLPLTVTRRCGKAIVDEARQLVSDFEAHESNGPGLISEARYPMQKRQARRGQHEWYELKYEETYMPKVQDGDMILCRANAPLVNQCFRFLKRGRRATILGRNVADQLLSLVERMEATSIQDLVAKINDWQTREIAKEQAQRNPSETRIQSITDRAECVLAFCEEAVSPAGVLEKINMVFAEKETDGIILSSIHKAKGLEAKRVFYIQGFGRPDDKMKPWEQQQEENLRYVAITRAIEELIYVR